MHRVYDLDIDWKGGSYLRPRVRSYPTSTMGRTGAESRAVEAHAEARSPDLPHESDGTTNVMDSGRGGSHLVVVQGRRYRRQRPRSREVTVVSVDEDQNLAVEAWITPSEASVIQPEEALTTKEKKRNEIPPEYRGHAAFYAKYLEGLPEHGPFNHEIKLKEAHNSSSSRCITPMPEKMRR